ncbi:MAG: pre-peptidase C-terminal domain-containing protein [Deltaproteobacteria bacterium]|nr:pre-peptidase C-terminal domain-containing protein [Deltaproteobacteria bacterium]
MLSPWFPRPATCLTLAFPWAALLLSVCVLSACAGEAPACVSDRDCDASMQCVANVCVETSPTGMCAIDDDCAKTDQCIEGHCAAIEIDCSRCAPEMICNPSTGLCRRPDSVPDPESDRTCSRDEDCSPPTSICGAEGLCTPGCVEDAAPLCEAPETCDALTGRCVETTTACDTDDACDPPRTICDTHQCVDGCTTSSVACEAGTTCNPDRGRCETTVVTCTQDSECLEANRICDLATGDCVPSCVETGCTEQFMCGQTGRCEPVVPVCTPDAWEPNDVHASAAQQLPATFADLSLCPDDVDLFTVHLEAQQGLHARATWIPSEGDLSLELLNEASSVVAVAEWAADTRALDFTSPSRGDYTLKVSLERDIGLVPGIDRYTLDIDRTCDADTFEDNDTQETASVIDASALSGLRSCPGDDDFYAFALSAGTQADVRVGFAHLDGDIDLEVFDPESTLVASSATLSDNESVTFRAQLSGQYIVRVFMAPTLASDFGASYTLTVDETPMTDVAFEITGVDFTNVGENVHIVGSADALGAWDPLRSVRLSGRTFPTWARTIALPQGELVRFKAIIIDTNNNNAVTWESGSNHEFTVPTTPTTISRAWRP